MSIKCPVCLTETDDSSLACPTCGFKFSGKTTSFKPISDANQQPQFSNNAPSNRQNDDNKQQKKAYLRLIQGPQGELLIPLSDTQTSIGRSPDCGIFLNDRTVSRKHAEVVKTGENYQITDSNSFNGLWINNQNVSQATLKPGDIIQIGIFFLRFEVL